ncbi:MAG TPA: hypothetical protein VG326_05060 [Tepidisphaeraceae bacterium]|jgi:hypothetical protein|nr:hypothetical protein [Tepidisphaeraceae bacterium]
MKKMLAFDRNAQQFRCDVGQPAKRFYLGGDAAAAQARKSKLVVLWGLHKASGGEKWTDELLTQAEAVRKGEAPKVRQRDGEPDEKYYDRAGAVARAVGPIQATATIDDYWKATTELLTERIAQLEALVRDQLGVGAVVGPSITIHTALDEWSKYRYATELDPNTGKETEHARTEKNVTLHPFAEFPAGNGGREPVCR